MDGWVSAHVVLRAGAVGGWKCQIERFGEGRDMDGRVGIVAARLECMSCKHVAESVYGKVCIFG